MRGPAGPADPRPAGTGVSSPICPKWRNPKALRPSGGPPGCFPCRRGHRRRPEPFGRGRGFPVPVPASHRKCLDTAGGGRIDALAAAGLGGMAVRFPGRRQLVSGSRSGFGGWTEESGMMGGGALFGEGNLEHHRHHCRREAPFHVVHGDAHQVAVHPDTLQRGQFGRVHEDADSARHTCVAPDLEYAPDEDLAVPVVGVRYPYMTHGTPTEEVLQGLRKRGADDGFRTSRIVLERLVERIIQVHRKTSVIACVTGKCGTHLASVGCAPRRCPAQTGVHWPVPCRSGRSVDSAGRDFARGMTALRDRFRNRTAADCVLSGHPSGRRPT